MLIAFLALLLNLQLRPFAEETLNFMNQAAQLNMFTFLLVALLLKVNIDGDQSARCVASDRVLPPAPLQLPPQPLLTRLRACACS
jgi:hypothetical protein